MENSATEVTRRAEDFVEKLAPAAPGAKFGFDRESLAWLMTFLGSYRAGPGVEVRKWIVDELATYYGECVIRAYGGAWIWNGRWVVEFQAGIRLEPYFAVRYEFSARLSSPGGYFDTIPALYLGGRDRVRSWDPIRVLNLVLDPCRGGFRLHAPAPRLKGSSAAYTLFGGLVKASVTGQGYFPNSACVVHLESDWDYGGLVLADMSARNFLHGSSFPLCPDSSNVGPITVVQSPASLELWFGCAPSDAPATLKGRGVEVELWLSHKGLRGLRLPRAGSASPHLNLLFRDANNLPQRPLRQNTKILGYPLDTCAFKY